MGLSVARALIKKGIHVQLFEQDTIPNPRGSSCDDHRLIRYPYGTHIGYMHMVRDAYASWDAVWQDIGAVHYAQTGTLVTSRTGMGWARDSLNALNEAGIPLAMLEPNQLTDYAPLLQLDNVHLAYYLESGGILFARQILASLKDYVIKNGATLYEQTKITGIDHANQEVHCQEGKLYAADLIIITAGPWTKDLFPGLPITPSQQTIHYLDVPKTDLPLWKNAPMVLDIDEDSGFYLVPPAAGLGLKIGDHRFSLSGHPDTPDPELPSEGINPTPYPITQTKTCFYTVAPNEAFIYKQPGNTHILTGFSGHGFKFGAVIGDRVAERINGEQTELEGFV